MARSSAGVPTPLGSSATASRRTPPPPSPSRLGERKRGWDGGRRPVFLGPNLGHVPSRDRSLCRRLSERLPAPQTGVACGTEVPPVGVDPAGTSVAKTHLRLDRGTPRP